MIAFAENIPFWASLLFLLIIPIPILMIARLAKKGASSSPELHDRANTIGLGVIIFYFAYLSYVTFASHQGWFDALMLPPKILLFTMFPLLAFLLLVVFNLPQYKAILRNIPLDDLVRLHIFRLIGSFFLILFFFGVLPKPIGLIAGIGDLVTALSSGYVAKVIKEGKPFARKLTFAWNTFGLLDIVATSATALILTKLSIDYGTQGVEGLAAFPFCFIPAFAPATIIFLHLSVYRRLYGSSH
ncbi:MAG: hypothetical protein RIF33_25525 [Cyclobacteriaceae bacterium]